MVDSQPINGARGWGRAQSILTSCMFFCEPRPRALGIQGSQGRLTCRPMAWVHQRPPRSVAGRPKTSNPQRASYKHRAAHPSRQLHAEWSRSSKKCPANAYLELPYNWTTDLSVGGFQLLPHGSERSNPRFYARPFISLQSLLLSSSPSPTLACLELQQSFTSLSPVGPDP